MICTEKSVINNIFKTYYFLGVEVVKSPKKKNGEASKYAALFEEKLPKMLENIQKVQDDIKSRLQKKVSKACSKDLEFGAEYLAFARQEIELIESQIETDAEENEENGFSVMNWVESKVRKSSKSQDASTGFETKIDEKINIVKEGHDEAYQGLVDDIAGENEDDEEEEGETSTTSTESNRHRKKKFINIKLTKTKINLVENHRVVGSLTVKVRTKLKKRKNWKTLLRLTLKLLRKYLKHTALSMKLED